MLHYEKVFAPRISPRTQHLRAFRRIAPIGASYPESNILSRINYFIPNRLSYPACGVGEEGIGRQGGREMRRKGSRRRSKMRPLRRKVRRKCDPLGRNMAESTSGGEGWGSKMQPLRQKVRQKCDPLGGNGAESTSGGQKCDPLSRKCVKNATP